MPRVLPRFVACCQSIDDDDRYRYLPNNSAAQTALCAVPCRRADASAVQPRAMRQPVRVMLLLLIAATRCRPCAAPMRSDAP